MPVVSQLLGVQILEALGLSTKNCASLRLDFEPNEIVVATARYYPAGSGIREIIEIVKRLQPVPETEPAELAEGEWP